MTLATRVYSLDIVRSGASVAVVVAHGLMYAGAMHQHLIGSAVFLATLGVEIFFVLSGFLIGPSIFAILNNQTTARGFWMRRAWRTLPNYYLFLIFNTLLFFFVFRDRAPSSEYLWFGQSLVQPAQGLFFIESWSLAVEEWFYLFSAIAASLLVSATTDPTQRTKWFVYGLIAVVVVSPIARACLTWFAEYRWDDGLRKLSWFRLDAIAFGVLASLIAVHQREDHPARRKVQIFAGCVIAAVGASYAYKVASSGNFLARPESLQPALIGSLALWTVNVGVAVSIAAISKIHHRPNSGAGHRIVSALAVWSYSLYLCHLPLLLILDYLSPSLRSREVAPLLLGLVFWGGLSLAAAAATYHYFERPMLKWRDRAMAAQSSG